MRFDRVETGARETGNQIVATEEARMRERCDAARVVDPCEHIHGRRTDSRHERRPPRREKPIEGLRRVGDVSTCDQSTRNPRPARGFRRVVPARLKHGLPVQHDAERFQAIDDLAHAVETAAPLFGKKTGERR